MLSVVVQPLGPERDVGVGHLQEGEEERAEHGKRHRPGQDDEGIAKAVELGGQDQEDQDDGQVEGGEEFVPLDAQLTGLAGVVDDVSLGQDLGGLVLQEAERLIQRPEGHPADLDGVELLKTVQRTGHDRFARVATVPSGTSLPFGPVT